MLRAHTVLQERYNPARLCTIILELEEDTKDAVVFQMMRTEPDLLDVLTGLMVRSMA